MIKCALYMVLIMLISYIRTTYEKVISVKKLIFVLISILTLVSCSKGTLQRPENLKIVDGYLTFDAVEHATSYTLLINNEEVTISNTYYTFTKGNYEVRVKAHAKGYEDSPYSEKLIFQVLSSEDDYTFLNLSFNYDLNSDSNLVILKNYVDAAKLFLKNNQNEILADWFIQESGLTYLKGSKIKELGVGSHKLILSYENEDYELTLNIKDKDYPYLMDNQTLYVDVKMDLALVVDLMGGELVSISADRNRPFLDGDLTIEGGKITMSKDYIMRSFDSLKESQQLVFTILVKKGTQNQTILLSLRKEK